VQCAKPAGLARARKARQRAATAEPGSRPNTAAAIKKAHWNQLFTTLTRDRFPVTDRRENLR
jgi:hypothetical protein